MFCDVFWSLLPCLCGRLTPARVLLLGDWPILLLMMFMDASSAGCRVEKWAGGAPVLALGYGICCGSGWGRRAALPARMPSVFIPGGVLYS